MIKHKILLPPREHIMTWCWQQQPELCPTFANILEHLQLLSSAPHDLL